MRPSSFILQREADLLSTAHFDARRFEELLAAVLSHLDLDDARGFFRVAGLAGGKLSMDMAFVCETRQWRAAHKNDPCAQKHSSSCKDMISLHWLTPLLVPAVVGLRPRPDGAAGYDWPLGCCVRPPDGRW